AFGHAHDGGEVVWSTWGVQVIAGDLITHVELFDPEDEAAARDRFMELAVLGSRQIGRPTLWSTALRVTEAMTPAFNAQDLDTITAFWHPDFTLFDRRRGPSAPPVIGRDVNAANLRAVFDVGLVRQDWEPIAIRGDRLLLRRTRVESESGLVVVFLEVDEVDDEGLMVRAVTFDDDDLQGALDELDARYMFGEGAPHAHLLR